MMGIPDRYFASYRRVAEDHVGHWRKTGLNPFQNPEAVRQNQDETVRLVRDHANGRTVLDAGCGMGDLMVELNQHDVATVGAEIAPAYYDVLRERNLDVRTSWLEALPFDDDCFDVVCCTDVLEHVLNVHNVAVELIRVTRPGGIIVVRVPDREPVEVATEYEFVHLRIFDPGTIVTLFQKICGCETVECVSFGNSIHLVARVPYEGEPWQTAS